MISKASCKVNALLRVIPYLSLSKKKKLVNLFFNAQFSNFPLIRILHSRIVNNTINCLHERYLRLLNGGKLPPFEKLLEQDKSVACTLAIRNY